MVTPEPSSHPAPAPAGGTTAAAPAGGAAAPASAGGPTGAVGLSGTTGAVAAWQHAPVALLRLDPDGLVLDANDALLGWLGQARDEVAGRVRIGGLLSVGGRIYWETHVAPLLRLNGRVDEVAVELRVPGGRSPVLMSAVAARGTVDVAMFAARERSRFERELVSARTVAERSADRLDVLQAVSRALAARSGVAQVVDALLDTVVSRLDLAAATAWLIDAHDRRVRVHATRTARPDVPPRGPHLAPPSGDDKVLVEPDGTVVLALRPDAGSRGALVLTPEAGPAHDPLDVDTVVAIARQASVALGRAALAEQNVSVAHELQHAMLSGEPPDDPRLDLSTVYRPGVRTLEVGGDWYDAFRLDDDRVGVVVGDVVGRGLAAATTMGRLRTALRALALDGAAPEVVLERLHGFVQATGSGLGATVVYGVVDLATGSVRYACAGHPPPVVAHRSGAAELLWKGRATPLGLDRDRPGGTVAMAPGDTLVLYTDGVVERRDRHLRVGLEALRRASGEQCAAGAPFDEEFVLGLVDAHAESDDTCLLALTWRL
ncbi:SpoIIE family protein phosphatase [Luteimicrobium subarcticum]|uniref:Serine phosphatase RsbU (Regulator of sigma subunit) n=1 Tax=Luteimicrobium subarcticum TaxID=620910 RepID=A0A2M8WW81_9MICO|nr:SpoIIE family protein phosphatase [Luteimicrobium subarcticum]PJI95178.1 serine phosphatase RsbU (regulator of sigma subunit) [Luteimicrobium subarcticum]